jgi:RimJ/RimL family protein N-acetyltransferase
METVEPLATDRLRLRPFTPDDRAALIALQGNPVVMRYYGSGQPLSPAQIDIVLDAHVHCRPKGYWAWAVALAGDPACQGQVTAICIDWQDEPWIELSWLLLPSMWRHGYATEAVQAVVRHGTGQLGWQKVLAGADVRNTRSERVMIKIGMHFAHEELDPYSQMRRVYTLVGGKAPAP